MHDVALMAAERWAAANTCSGSDPTEFGSSVARAYLAAETAMGQAGGKNAAAALVDASAEGRSITVVRKPDGWTLIEIGDTPLHINVNELERLKRLLTRNPS